MFSLFKFTLAANLLVAIILMPAYLFIPFVGATKVIDITFLSGVFFWLISTVVRIGQKRFRKEWRSHEVIVTDPQIVLRSNSWALRFLVAGVPGISGAIIWGAFFY